MKSKSLGYTPPKVRVPEGDRICSFQIEVKQTVSESILDPDFCVTYPLRVVEVKVPWSFDRDSWVEARRLLAEEMEGEEYAIFYWNWGLHPDLVPMTCSMCKAKINNYPGHPCQMCGYFEGAKKCPDCDTFVLFSGDPRECPNCHTVDLKTWTVGAVRVEKEYIDLSLGSFFVCVKSLVTWKLKGYHRETRGEGYAPGWLPIWECVSIKVVKDAEHIS